MKKLLVMAAMAIFVSSAAQAQIGESKSKKIETTYTTTTVVEKKTNPNYNRIIFGWAPTTFSAYGESETMQGFNVGWIGGYNVTKGKCLPLYVETGIVWNADFGECMTYDESDILMNFEVPINVTYRYNFKNTKIYVAPYFGFHFKVNALWMSSSEDYFDYDGTNRFQFGMQLGVNFDLGKFNIGFGWNNDFMPIWASEVYGEEISFHTSGARINIGVTF
jgi:hypothetical protein